MHSILNKINLLNGRNYYILVILLILVGVSVRTYNISGYPGGLNQDEVSTGYDAYSILKYGFDRNANTYPVQLESWGNGQYALYAYGSMPFISFFGLNAFSVRILNALLGVISVLLFFLIFLKVFDRKIALLALFLMAINPWNIMASRFGLDCNSFPPVFLIGVFFLILAVYRTSKYLIISFFFFALCLYAYGTAYFFIPLFLICISPYLFLKLKLSKKDIIASVGVLVLIALPVVACVFVNHFNLSTLKLGDITIPRFSENRTTVVFNILTPDFAVVFFKNIVRFLSVIFLQSDSYIYNAIPSTGTVYHLSLPFFVVGFYSIISKKRFLNSPVHFIFLVWLACATLLGICIHTNINRVNIVFYPIIYFTVIGIVAISEWINEANRMKFYKLIISVYFVLFLFFCSTYFSVFNDKVKADFSYGLGDALKYAEEVKGHGTIHVTGNTINMPYIYACFYNQTQPDAFIKTVLYDKRNHTGFRPVLTFGHYSFCDYRLPTDSVWIVSETEFLFLQANSLNYTKFGNYYVIYTK